MGALARGDTRQLSFSLLTTFLLEIAFCGREFCGWQVQPGSRSVQGTLGEACEALLGAPVRVTGCSRTDAGVHARQFFCTIAADAPPLIPASSLPRALNAALPRDIAIKSARAVPASFHPRYRAREKVYEYSLRTDSVRNPLMAGLTWEYGRELALAPMRKAAGMLVGRWDFRSFSAASCDVANRVRDLRTLTIEQTSDGLRFTLAADGFLTHMARILVGTLVEVGEGRRSPGEMARILAARDRRAAGRTAPAEGLTLARVIYEDLPEGEPPS